MAIDLDALEKLCAEATPGPWECDFTLKNPIFRDVSEPVLECGYEGGQMRDEDANFIAAARSALPELIAEVRELRAENEKLNAELEFAHIPAEEL